MLNKVTLSDDQLFELVGSCIDSFYSKLIGSIDKLDVKKVIKRKNPYLFRAKAIGNASEIVGNILSAFVSSSEETIFGNEFFEPIATAVSGGNKALAEGIDIMVETEDTIYAFAVKSGTNVFNAASRKKQEQNFNAAKKLADQVRKRFVPIIGYGYGKKKMSDKGIPKIYLELAGKDFWCYITGDNNFHKKLATYMGDRPEKRVAEFNAAYDRALNRFVGAFTTEFCNADGSIDWDKLIEFNSGN